MASNIANIAKIPELRKRIFFTLALLAVYRIGVFVTVPGVDRQVMKNILKSASGSFLGLLNMFSGGALEQLSIFALGIMPYISSSIILQLLTVVLPVLDRLQKEGEQGRRKINQYTRYGTIVISLVQAFFIARWLEGNNRSFSQFGSVVLNPGLGFELLTMITLTTGTAFLMWIGEQVTERGIGNGISLIIFAGIISASHHLLAGQVVDAKEVLFEIVDPARLAVEALAYDVGIAKTLVSASALADQTALDLKFVGGGQQLREQALPLLFRITNRNAAVAVGQPVKVFARTEQGVKGATAPRTALTQVGAGETAVWVHIEAERFVARRIRHQSLDAANVAILDGLHDGDRVVTVGAGLLSQVR